MPKTRKTAEKLRERFFMRMYISLKRHPYLFMTYFILRLSVIVVMITQFFNKAYDSVFLCLLTLVLFTLPSFVEKRLKIDVPNTLEIIILLFIYSAEMLGEISEYYIIFPYWDTMLHTVNGFLCAAIGIALIDILNRSERFAFKMSPFFVAMVAFCFSMTVGVLWEFFEFAMDTFFHMDMQKDTIVPVVRSVLLHPDGRNIPVVVEIESVVINGETWNYGGYLDIGLIDTMKDLLVNFVGAAVFSVIGFFYIKNRGKGWFVKGFIPSKIGKRKTESHPETVEDDKTTRIKVSDNKLK